MNQYKLLQDAPGLKKGDVLSETNSFVKYLFDQWHQEVLDEWIMPLFGAERDGFENRQAPVIDLDHPDYNCHICGFDHSCMNRTNKHHYEYKHSEYRKKLFALQEHA